MIPSSGHSSRYVASPAQRQYQYQDNLPALTAPLTLKEHRGPSEEVKHQPLSQPCIVDVSHVQSTLVPTIIVVEELFKRMRSETSLIVVRHAVGAMLVVVDSVDVDAEEAVSHVSKGNSLLFRTKTGNFSARRTDQAATQVESDTTNSH